MTTKTLDCCCGHPNQPPPGTGSVVNCPSNCGYWVDGLQPSHYLAILDSNSYDTTPYGTACDCIPTHPLHGAFLLTQGINCSPQYRYIMPNKVCGFENSSLGPELILQPSGSQMQLFWRAVWPPFGIYWQTTWAYTFRFGGRNPCGNVEDRWVYDQTYVLNGLANGNGVAQCYAQGYKATVIPIWF